MSKILSKITLSVFLAGVFTIVALMAIEYQKLDAGFYIVMVFLIIYLFFFGFATGESLSNPVKKLLERAKDLNSGNLSSRIYLEDKDEIGELAKIFNKIAENLEASKMANEETKRSVGIKVKAETQSLEETINALEQKIRNRTIELEKMSTELKKIQEELTEREGKIRELQEEIDKLRGTLKSGQKPAKLIKE